MNALKEYAGLPVANLAARPITQRLLCLVFLFALLVLGSAPTPSRAEAPSTVDGFAFTAMGDMNSTAFTTANLNAIPVQAEFNLALGDLSYGALAPESAWCTYVQTETNGGSPWELVSGNHDMDGQPTGHINNFAACLPHSNGLGTVAGTYGKEYYFDYAGAPNLARIIMISPNLTLDGQVYDYTVGSPHYNWLVSAIDDARAQKIKWIIVGMHKNCISMGQKTCEIGADLMNLLVSKKVDLVLQGHDHNYQRSKQLRLNSTCTAIVPGTFNPACVYDDGSDQYYRKGKGPIVVIAGTGGTTNLYPVSKADSEAKYFAAAQGGGVGQRFGFLYVEVSPNQLDARFYPTSADSNFADTFRIGKGAAFRVSIPAGNEGHWKYLDDGSDQGTAWQALEFDDSAWAQGITQLGYGDGDEATEVGYGPDANDKYITTYFRNTFTLPGTAEGYTGLYLRLLRDDGAVVYLNGHEVVRSNMPGGDVAYQTLGSKTVSDKKENKFYKYFIDPAYLQEGPNTLAVEIHQSEVTSSDISFDLKLDGSCADKTKKPKLVYPANGETIPGFFITLDWEDSTSPCPTFYNLEVREGSETGLVVASYGPLTLSEQGSLAGVVAPGQTYYWQVTQCSSKCKKSAWWNFSVGQ